MGLRRSLALLGSVALLSSGAMSIGEPALAGHSETGRMPVLRGTTTFTTSTTSRFLVRLPRKISVQSLTTNLSPSGRVSGYVITDTNSPVGRGQTIEAYWIGRCDTEGCRGEKNGFLFEFRSNLGKHLKKGLYRVFVLADSAPVTLTLRAPELDGRAAYTGGTPVRSEVATLPVGVSSQAQSNVISAGDFVSWEDHVPEFGMFGLWVTTDSHVATGFGDCAYENGSITRPPADELDDAAFQPGCPTGDGFEFEHVSEEPGGKFSQVLTSARWGDPVGLGGWYSTVSEVSDYGAVAIWIDYRS
jgi:hypothetical protein